MIDNSRLTQVLINLISNAIKFTDQGYINVSIDYEPNLNTIPAEIFGEEPLKQTLPSGIVNHQTICGEIEEEDSFDSYLDDAWQLDECIYINFFDHHKLQVKNGSTQTVQSYPTMTN